MAINAQLDRALAAGDTVALCQPVVLVARRALSGDDQAALLAQFENDLRPRLGWAGFVAADTYQAARLLCEETRKRSVHLGSVGLLLAAMAIRLDAVIVSSDVDFDAVAVKREDWRVS